MENIRTDSADRNADDLPPEWSEFEDTARRVAARIDEIANGRRRFINAVMGTMDAIAETGISHDDDLIGLLASALSDNESSKGFDAEDSILLAANEQRDSDQDPFWDARATAWRDLRTLAAELPRRMTLDEFHTQEMAAIPDATPADRAAVLAMLAARRQRPAAEKQRERDEFLAMIALPPEVQSTVTAAMRAATLAQAVEIVPPEYRWTLSAMQPADVKAEVMSEIQKILDSKPVAPAASNSGHIAVSESELSDEFVARHSDKCRWDVNRGAWFTWTGGHWKRDEGSLAFHWSKMLIRSFTDSLDPKARVAAGRAAFAGGVERFARADPALAVSSDRWDADPWLLGTPGGAVDLSTGRLRPSRREDYVTRQTAVAPAPPGTPHPVWSKFLGEATSRDDALQRFLQQVAGYALTGVTREHALFFIYGPGGNGKSVFLDVLQGIAGNYATVASMDAFTASYGDKHSTDLAALAGARLVTASETEEGRQWAESRIKALTGGDSITARFMRQDNFTYRPQFKLLIVGNHQPALRNVDEAARRRFNIIPFTHKPVAKDDRLTEKLQTEWPAILRWAIDGCLDWQANGLVRPKVVLDATDEYMDSQNLVSRWIEDRCDLGKLFSDASANLFRDWQSYAVAAGEKPGTAKWFSQALQREGCIPARTNGERRFDGIRLKPPEPAKTADIPTGG